MHSEPMLLVKDVKRSVAFYKKLLGCENDHDRDDFDRLVIEENVLLMVHRSDGHEHGALPPVAGSEGNGCLIFFYVDDLAGARERARALKAKVVVEPHANPVSGWREFTLADPDGYRIALVET